MAGKKFAAEFALRRNVSAQDKILIQDSDDDVVKYAYPPQIASLSGYAYAQSVADLPLLPTNKSIGYIVGQMLYIYVGMGGDTKDGLYQSVGFFVGPQGVQGEKGEKGERGEQGVQGPKGDNGGLSLQELDEYLATKQYVTGDTLADMLAGYVSNTSLMRDYVTIAKTQDVTGVKNFTAGVQFGGLSMYKSKGDTVFLDGNLVVRGGITAFGTNETISPSIFEALPIDGTTIKRDPITKELYVDTTVVGGGGSGGGGGISIADVENYLTTNGYLTGITGAMVTNALGYTPFSASGGNVNGSINLAGDYDLNMEGYNVVSRYQSNYFLFDSAIERGFNSFIVGKKINFQTSTTTTKVTTATLDGNGNFSITGALKLPAVDSGFSNPRITFGDSVIRIGATTAGLLGVYASGDIRLNPNSVSSANNAMGLFLKATGLNGVNNNAPTEALDVAGNILASGTMRLSTLAANAFTGAQLLWGNGEARIGVNASSKRMTMYAESFRFRPASSVASSSVGVDIDVSGNLLATGGITATNSSDKRLKKNIRKFNASKVLLSLGGVWEYEYIDSEVQKNHIYEGTHYGLIYQNVKGTTLDMMCHEREDGFGTLNYIHQKFISLIAGATMENISEVEKLKRKIRHLEAKVNKLEQRA